MSRPLRVALLGFSAFERNTLSTCLRLDTRSGRRYEPAAGIEDCDLVIADADQQGPARAVAEARRIADTVFIGQRPPTGVAVGMVRPIDALQVLRALDQLAEGRSVPEAPPAPRAGPAQALLVDDSEIALRFLELRLQAAGLATRSARNGDQALALLDEQRADFVFIDVELGAEQPQGGLLLCQQIRRQNIDGSAPVLVMVSAHQAEIDRARGALAGCDAYLGKPLEADALATLLRRYGVRAPSAPPG